MPGRRPQPPPTALTAASWDLDRYGVFRLVKPDVDLVRVVDSEWPPQRPIHHIGRHWQWAQLLAGKPEQWALVDSKGKAAAMWCSGSYRAVQIGQRRSYRLDYFEVDPERRGSLVSPFAVNVIGARALELGDSIILAAFNSRALLRFYEDLGARDASQLGWHWERGLVPLVFDRATLIGMKGDLDELAI